ncbi:transglycosylase SLT domain-containing protein [Tahibacter harae]|uniref:Transglycosylase SLT domain-containing protein n=1 Tax=Tahibacter harae TaxID=2963937 RepID=A0ABT1QZB2_9GAMM|nr:transglycosylase SLT domain-containing protein [Tahibacter harae]MCQ4167625.1 transglycosylase SLT domain-containing protein [Tahibacter harae]
MSRASSTLGSCRRFSARWLVLLAAALPLAVPAADRSQERQLFRRALSAVEQGRDWKTEAAGLADYPLLPVLQARELARQLDKLKPEDIQDFSTRWPDTLPTQELRKAWLLLQAEKKQWPEFLAVYTPVPDRELRCHALAARLAGGGTLNWQEDLQALWDEDRPLPAACDAALDWAAQNKLLDSGKIWQRIDHALAANKAGIVDPLATRLSAAERASANRLALALRDAPAALNQAKNWPDDARHRRAVVTALSRQARKDSAAAEANYTALSKHFKFSAAERGDVAAAFALYRATEFDADALKRLANLPAAAQTDATREWRVRVALAASDWKAALAALDALGDTQKADAEWRYLRARVLRKLDRESEADALLQTLAQEANFYGFLAADWIDQPYAICPLTLQADRAAEQRLLEGGLARAFEWRALDEGREARREWDFVLARLDREQRRQAADLAYREGWYDRAVFALNKGEELKLYEQRFPLAREPQIRRASHDTGLDPAWTYAIIRAESAWVEDARSSADAYGLMQLLPGTAARVAKSAGISYSRAEDLYHGDTNIALGTRYLSQMAERYNGAPWLASAAYNAGPGAVERWLGLRGQLEPDFFIASIPYKETREYVARVLAFSVIYDWRMNGKALAVAARLPRYGQNYAAPGRDTPRKAVTCPAAVASPAQGTAPAAVAAPGS